MGDDWQPEPAISSGWPVSFHAGTVGFGVGIGCGVGVGFGGPVSLAAIPVLGQASQGIQAGLGGISSVLGGAGATARAAVRRLGIQGLDAGFGCGVGVGYGFGAGLMLKPSAAEQLVRSGGLVAGHVTQLLSSKLQQAGITQPAAALHSTAIQQPTGLQPNTSSVGGQIIGPYFPPDAHQQLHLQHQLAPEPDRAGLDVAGMLGSSSSSTSCTGNVSQQQQQQQQVDAVVMCTLLQQQEDFRRLRKQNKQLRAAVCKLDPGAVFCKDNRREKKHDGSKACSSDAWSD